jgi:uncharacterized protein (DUF1778 family)
MQTTQSRINLRTTHGTKQVIEQAAEMMGTTVSAFMLQNAYDAAKRVLAEQQILTLSNRDREAFLDALNNPPAPSKELRKLLRK